MRRAALGVTPGRLPPGRKSKSGSSVARLAEAAGAAENLGMGASFIPAPSTSRPCLPRPRVQDAVVVPWAVVGQVSVAFGRPARRRTWHRRRPPWRAVRAQRGRPRGYACSVAHGASAGHAMKKSITLPTRLGSSSVPILLGPLTPPGCSLLAPGKHVAEGGGDRAAHLTRPSRWPRAAPAACRSHQR